MPKKKSSGPKDDHKKPTAHPAAAPAHATPHAEEPAEKVEAAAPPPINVNPGTDVRDVSGASAYFSTLLTQLAAKEFTPTAAAITVWSGFITKEKAHQDGVSVGSDRVIADAMLELGAAVPYLLQKGYLGYGPKRAYYAITLAKQLADSYQVVLRLQASQASASQVKQGNVKAATRGRAALHGVLSELAHGDPSLDAGMHKTIGKGKRAVHIAESVAGLGALAQGVLDQGEKDEGLAEVLADMGLTTDVVAGAQAASAGITSATTDHNAERTAQELQADALNELDGRVWFELEALSRSADREKSQEGRSVPIVRFTHLGRVQHRRAPPAPAPGAPAASAPAAPASPAGDGSEPATDALRNKKSG